MLVTNNLFSRVKQMLTRINKYNLLPLQPPIHLCKVGTKSVDANTDEEAFPVYHDGTWNLYQFTGNSKFYSGHQWLLQMLFMGLIALFNVYQAVYENSNAQDYCINSYKAFAFLGCSNFLYFYHKHAQGIASVLNNLMRFEHRHMRPEIHFRKSKEADWIRSAVNLIEVAFILSGLFMPLTAILFPLAPPRLVPSIFFKFEAGLPLRVGR